MHSDSQRKELYASSNEAILTHINPTQKVGLCNAKPTFFFCFPDTILLSLQAICRYFPPPSRFLLVEKVGAMWLIG